MGVRIRADSGYQCIGKEGLTMMRRCPTWIGRQTWVSPTHTENSEEEAFSEEVNTSKFARRGKNRVFFGIS